MNETDDRNEAANPTRELAIITQLVYGYNDKGVGMVFGIQLLDGTATLFMEVNAVTNLLLETKAANIMTLQGRPCAVNVTPDKVVSFDGMV